MFRCRKKQPARRFTFGFQSPGPARTTHLIWIWSFEEDYDVSASLSLSCRDADGPAFSLGGLCTGLRSNCPVVRREVRTQSGIGDDSRILRDQDGEGLMGDDQRDV